MAETNASPAKIRKATKIAVWRDMYSILEMTIALKTLHVHAIQTCIHVTHVCSC